MTPTKLERVSSFTVIWPARQVAVTMGEKVELAASEVSTAEVEVAKTARVKVRVSVAESDGMVVWKKEREET